MEEIRNGHTYLAAQNGAYVTQNGRGERVLIAQVGPEWCTSIARARLGCERVTFAGMLGTFAIYERA